MPSAIPGSRVPLVNLKTGMMTVVWFDFFSWFLNEVYMPAVNAVLIAPKTAENAETTQYTSTGVITIIDKFTARNYSGAAVTLTVSIVPSGVAVGNNNRIVSYTLAAGETYTFPELIGHNLKVGDFISTLAGAAGAVAIRASGRQVPA